MNGTNNSGVTPRLVFYEDLDTPLQACRQDSESVSCLIANINGAVTGCLLPAVMVVGLLGNSLVAYLTLCRVKPLTKQNCFYGCIAVVDGVTLVVQGVLNGFLNKGLPWLSNGRFGLVMITVSDLGCKVRERPVGLRLTVA
ncbi:hypothetical protein BOX15_Mlig002009g2 [Macrostomum lignano]|uniref:G_PROTEIN_RECEP_F1_2 domain-containing protein n=1 Tax=Macrostomum lignano TaxID=282301 RepID=A0A267EIK2_9PLAT|nr:hypothetical protein BOX15_Mlig002009g5 [Macrostomum lignano]PAA61331.1 hypothetical protein BOX15_Mlig002009g2 [Macrostomum lignano]